jgi:hypothetical protein
MRIRNFVGVAVLAMVSLMAQVARAGDQDFKLSNKTGVSITKIMVSPHDKTTWGEDIMGKETLGDGESVDIKFHATEEAEYWDLKIVDKDGHEIVWANLNLLKISKLTIHYTDGKATADVE